MSLLVGYADSQVISRFEGKVMFSLVCVILSGGRGYAWSMSLLGRYASCQVPSRFGGKVMFSLVCVILSGAIQVCLVHVPSRGICRLPGPFQIWRKGNVFTSVCHSVRRDVCLVHVPSRGVCWLPGHFQILGGDIPLVGIPGITPKSTPLVLTSSGGH